jgi:uncharacterized protein (DUF983 family)
MASITCPRCGSQVPLRFLDPGNRPFCARCGWNLDRAEAALAGNSTIIKFIPLAIGALALFVAFGVSPGRATGIAIPFVVFGLIAMIPLWGYHSARNAIAAARSAANPSFALAQPPVDPALQMLQSLPRPRRVRFRIQGSAGAFVAVLAAFLGLMVFFLVGAQGGNFSRNNDTLTMALPLLLTLFVIALIIGIPLLREKRYLPLMVNGELAFGHVVSQQMVQQGKASYSRINYEFKPNTGQVVRNSCRDLSGLVFEDMTIPVFYDSLDPSKNVAACASYLMVVNTFQ